jgi:hypothetical protein
MLKPTERPSTLETILMIIGTAIASAPLFFVP